MADMVRGISAVVRNLEKLSKDIEAGALKARMRAALEIERDAVAEVPVISGRLKGSINTQEVGDVVEVGSGVKAGSEVEYAHKVEFGDEHRAAHPYLQPAVDLARQKYPKMIIEDVKAEIL